MRNKTVALGLGSNLNKPIENLRMALSEIKNSKLFQVLKVASIYESKAQLPDNADKNWYKDFLNSVVLCRVSADCEAPEILHEIKKIENTIGRSPAEKWAPRLIDIDILYWDQDNYVSENLHIPHKNLIERPFALLPLLEVWPALNLNLPNWSSSWGQEIPFETCKSRKYFWPRFVGILNVTKDSFSDGGRFLNSESLKEQINLLIKQGADIIDIGAESTRPGALGVPEAEEFEILNWALTEVKSDVQISLDCRKARVVKRLLDAHQIDYLNDVCGFSNLEMKNLLKFSKLPAFVMHSLGIPPKSDRILDIAVNPCLQLSDWWQQKNCELQEMGIEPNKLIFDPGIGFGKNPQQSLFILKHLEQLSEILNPVMIGHSRKSFLSLISDRQAAERDGETALITKNLNLAYVQYLRVHDIESQKRALI